MNRENEFIAKLNSEKHVYDIAYIDTVPIIYYMQYIDGDDEY